MNLKFIKRGIILATLTSSILVPVCQVQAADAVSLMTVPQQNKVVVLDKTLVNVVEEMKLDVAMETTIKIESAEELQLKEKLAGYSFAILGEDDYLVVYREAAEESEVAGKVFANSTLEIVTKEADWSEVKSGNVVGYVQTEKLVSGKKAIERAKEILTEKILVEEILIEMMLTKVNEINETSTDAKPIASPISSGVT